MSSRQLMVLCVVLALGCGSDGAPGAETPRDAVPAGGDSLRLSLDVPRRVAAGERVPITLRATNTSARTIDLYLQGREIAFDIEVTDAAGAVLWRRLEGAVVQAILQVKQLAPGASLELSDSWNQRRADGSAVGPGTYTVMGLLLTESPEGIVLGPASLEIVPR